MATRKPKSPAKKNSPPPPAPADESAANIVATIDELAAALGIGARQVGYDLRAGMPGERGRYNVAAAAEWRSARKTVAAAIAGDGAQAAARRRLDLAKAEREEIKLARDRGELVPAAEVASLVIAHVTECRAHLEELPPALAAALPEDLPDDVRRAARESIDRQVRKCLSTLAELARRQAVPAHDQPHDMPREITDPPPKPAAKPRSKKR
ncbi:MAG: hypothetical protein AB7O62_00295 [Pirellulales bacterium]